MPNEQLVAYIKNARAEKREDSEILAALREAGWRDADISEAFFATGDISTSSQTNSPSTDLVATSNATAQTPLRPVWPLFKEALGIYFSRIAVIVGILIIPFLVDKYLYAFALGKNDIIAASLFIIKWFLNTLSYLAVLFALKNSSGFVDSYKESIKNFQAYIWIVLLIWLMGAGGVLMGIVPGIVFVPWFAFVTYIFVNEGRSGIGVFYRGREYARGRWWALMGRLALLFLILAVPLALIVVAVEKIFSVLVSEQVIDHIGVALMALFVVPIIFIFLHLVYRNLFEINKSSASSGVPPKKLYFVSAVLGAPLVLLAVTLLFLQNFASDIPPIDDSDLRLPVEVQVPKSDNAFYDLDYLNQEGVFKGTYDKDVVAMLDGGMWNEATATKALADDQDALAHFESATQKPEFQDPYNYIWMSSSSADYFTAPIWAMNPAQLLKISRLEGLRAISLARQGKEQEAFGAAFGIATLAKKLEDNPGGEIEYLVGSGMKAVAMQTLQRISEISKGSDGVVGYISQLEEFKDSKKGLSKTQKIRYVGMMRTLDGYGFGAFYLAGVMADNKNIEVLGKSHKVLASPNFYFKVNKTKVFFVEDTRSNIKKIEGTCSPEFTNFRNLTLSPWWLNIFSENSTGKFIHDTLSLSLNLSVARCDDELHVAATQTLLALKVYSLDNKGKLPTTLDELVPKYVSSTPIDPFTKAPLKYSAADKILTSPSEKYPSFKINFGEAPH